MLTKHFINTVARDNFSTHCIKQMGRGAVMNQYSLLSDEGQRSDSYSTHDPVTETPACAFPTHSTPCTHIILRPVGCVLLSSCHTVWAAMTNTVCRLQFEGIPSALFVSSLSLLILCMAESSTGQRNWVPKAGRHTGSLLSGPAELGCPAIWATFMIDGHRMEN